MKQSRVHSPSHPEERRCFGRHPFPPSLAVEARWNGTVLPLKHAPAHENISAGGIVLCVAQGPTPSVGAEVTVSFPLVEQPYQHGCLFARCQGRVVRQDAPNRVAVYFEEVKFVSETQATRLPGPAFASA